ncbi:MAG: response regulator, partial [Planctomycetes bacterium]|nr:response regulator [Planctomycetota bacterium]
MTEAEKRTILAVDDAPENLDVIKGILVPKYRVRMATRAQVALKLAEEQQPNLILLDITMPEMDGFECCRRLKQLEATKDIPVIFLTGRTSEQDLK